jgi:DNA-binding CsgD family transcriptional regulator
MRRCVYDLVATFPDSQKLIATELILKVDGMTGVELAAVLNVAPGTVSGQLKKLRTKIADYIRELELGISA